MGYQGFGNLGDEAILGGIERLLLSSAVEPAVLFGGPGLGETSGLAGARRMSPWKLIPTPSALRALSRTHLLLLGGGGLINDHWPTLIPRYLLWALAARLLGNRVVWLGVGVGPIRRRPWRWLARLVARLSDPVLVRDQASAILLGGPNRRIRVIPDPAFFLRPAPPATREPVLALIVRPLVTDEARASDELTALLADVAAAGRAAGLEPRIFMMAPSVDRVFADRVADAVAAEGGDRPIVEPLGQTPAQALERLGRCSAVASVRLHGVILSALAGLACLPVAYDPKIIAAAEQLGLADLVAAPGDDGARSPADLLSEARSPARTALVADRVRTLCGRLEEVRAMVEAA